MHNATIEINIAQFLCNLKAIRQHLEANNDKTSIRFCLPVKANAYGHGLVGIAKVAEPYVDYLAVACVDEGATLREYQINKPILVFGGFSEEQIPGLITNNLEITISSLYKAELVANFCLATQQSCKVHIKVDTGMNRIGVRVSSAKALIDYVLSIPELELVGVYSHLTSSEEADQSFTQHQINQFAGLVKYVKAIKPEVICHLANSGGVSYFPNSYFDMVRPGLLAYGYFPNPSNPKFPLTKIRPCFSLKSKVTYFKVVDKAQGISYNHKYITPNLTRVVTVPVGYGDGYRRMLSNLGEVLIRGKKYQITGNICMDMFMVDIGPTGESYVNDEVVLIGHQADLEITLESVAQKCNTISYEILCGFNERIPRVYVTNNN